MADRDSFFDTLTGRDLEDADPVMQALGDVDEALEERGRAIAELRARSEPPPPPPPAAPAPALAA